jgi:hypothetical protein
MSIAQGHVFVIISSQKGPINICPKINCYEDMGILRFLMELLRINQQCALNNREGVTFPEWRCE